MKPKIIAFYLPQFYPFPENDEWWGKGFTEWTTVGKAKPLFKGHYQPRVPADLGYYDLRLPIIREQQAELAREAGVTAFCYWHYWFGNGKRLLSDVFTEVLESGHPDFPFCLGWANHPWYKKTWAGIKSKENKLLIEQTYPGIEDAKLHFSFLLKAFQDPRYIKINGSPFFFIFDPKQLPKEYLFKFREWAQDAGFPDLYIVANIFNTTEPPEKYTSGHQYDAVMYNRLSDTLYHDFDKKSILQQKTIQAFRYLKQLFLKRPIGAVDYGKIFPQLITDVERSPKVIPQLLPQWDHSPRSKDKAAVICYNSRPEFFYRHACAALDTLKDKPEEEQIILLKSWNEWGEGNYMEPDTKYGKGYIRALRKALDEFNEQ